MNIYSAKAELTNPRPPSINLGVIGAEIAFIAGLLMLSIYFLG